MAKLMEESYSKQNMKIAMLKHEQTFRHQVYELHRLYRIQKLLMKNIRENRGKTEVIHEEEDEGEDEGIEESEIELTLGPSNYSNQIGGRRRKKFGEGSDSGSSSSTNGSAQKSRNFYRNGEFVGFDLEVEDDMRLSQHHNHHHHHHPNPWLYQVVSLNLT